MKKLILILFLFSFSFAQSQVLTKQQAKLPLGTNYLVYTAAAGDTLTDNQDSIRFPILINRPCAFKFAGAVTFDTISGADTVAAIYVYGRNFSGESWIKIFSDSVEVNASAFVSEFHNTSVNYRWLMITFKRSYASVHGSGVAIKQAELMIFDTY